MSNNKRRKNVNKSSKVNGTELHSTVNEKKDVSAIVDIKKYYSYNIPIQINEDIPAGSILNINIETPIKSVRDINQNVIYTNLSPAKEFMDYLSANDEAAFAKTSKLYNKIMSDGYVFNPYIHRKYIACMYLRMMKSNWNKEFSNLTYMYCIKTTVEEISKLAFLYCEEYSRREYEERSKFYTFAACKNIMLSYALDVKNILKDELDKIQQQKPDEKFYLPRYGYVSESWVMRKFCNYTEFIANINLPDCIEYKHLAYYIKQLKRAEGGNLFKITKSKNSKLHKDFRAVYQGAGAFYTMKFLIMFEGLNFENCNQAQSLDNLNEMKAYEGYILHAILKRLLEKNNYEY